MVAVGGKQIVIVLLSLTFPTMRAWCQETPVIPLTVCEALTQRVQLNGKLIAVLGAYVVPDSFSDGGIVLVEDHCTSPAITKSRADEVGGTVTTESPSRIRVVILRPILQKRDIKLDTDVLNAKVKTLEKSTARRCYSRAFVTPGTSRIEWRKDRVRWGVAYGVLRTPANLQPTNGNSLLNELPAALWVEEFKTYLVGPQEPCE